MNNTEMILEFIGLYQVQITIDVKALKEAVASELHNEISTKSNHIKQTIEYIGALALREKLQQLESAGKNGTDIAHINTLFLDIENEITVLLQEIDSYRNKL